MAEPAWSKEERDERERIKSALAASGYVIRTARLALGYSIGTMQRRLDRYGLQELVAEHSRRVQRRRMNAELPPAPHEVSRQAQEQADNRALGLCSCGRPPAPLRDGSPGRMCGGCRDKARDRKRSKAA